MQPAQTSAIRQRVDEPISPETWRGDFESGELKSLETDATDRKHWRVRSVNRLCDCGAVELSPANKRSNRMGRSVVFNGATPGRRRARPATLEGLRSKDLSYMAILIGKQID